MADYHFSYHERLRKKLWLKSLFKSGKKHKLKHLYLRCLPAPEASIPSHQVIFLVPKRIVKGSVKRHLLQRRMREGYRKHKHFLPISDSKRLPYLLAYIYCGSHCKLSSYQELVEDIILGLKGVERES